jgi:type 1 glutamine amidotransferase
MKLFTGLLVLFCMGLVLLATSYSGPAEKKIKVLIVDGFSNHDWKKTTDLIHGILEPTGKFSVSVSTAPPKAAAEGWDKWRPTFQDFDVVIQNCNDIGGGPSWPKPVQSAFEEYVKNGGGVFIFHSANNAFPNWPAYNDIIGLGWRNKNQGVALAINDKDQTIERVPAGEGGNTGHGPRIDAVLTRIGEHPIHKGLPKRWKTPGLEVYFYARGPAKNLDVLSYAFDPQTKKNWPIEWVVTHGKGRVYNSTFGHVWKTDMQPVAMRCAGMQTVMLRALQWLARREVTFQVPADFPTEQKLSVRPEIAVAPLPAPG